MFDTQRTCSICHNNFIVNKFSSSRQIVCQRKECRKIAKKQRQADWLARNPDYFKGSENVERVRQWRLKKANKVAHLNIKLETQNSSESKSSQKAKSCSKLNLENEVLQDLAFASQSPILIGFMSFTTGSVLQDEVLNLCAECFIRGQQLLGHPASADASHGQ
jgi:hypothetical protein